MSTLYFGKLINITLIYNIIHSQVSYKKMNNKLYAKGCLDINQGPDKSLVHPKR